jgi:tetratricopeptide (TPR) repeat protein
MPTPPSAGTPEQSDWDHEIRVADDAYYSDNFVQAEKHYRKSLELAERLQLGDVQRATSLASVAQALRYQKKFTDAEPLFREALAIRERVLPPNHPRTALTLEGLGACLYGQNRLDEAEGYLLRAVAIRDQLSGNDDSSCQHGKALQLLGRTYNAQGKQDKALSMYVRAFSIWLAANEKCTVIVPVMNDMAALYWSQKKLDKAEEMYRTTIPLLQKELGQEQPELVAKQRVQLARTYLAEDKFAEAEPELRKAIPVFEQAGPQGQSELLHVLNMYRMVLEKLKRPTDVERVQSQIDAINGLRTTSADPLVRWQGLMQLSFRAKSQEQQLELVKQALIEAEKLPPGKELVDTLSRLASYSVPTDQNTAEAYSRRALEVSEIAFGKESKEAADAMDQLAFLYENQGRFAEAEPLRKSCAAILEKTGPEIFFSTSLNKLGNLYLRQKKFAEAEPQYLRALQFDETHKDKTGFNISYDAEWLGRLYMDWGKYEESVPYFERALQLDAKQQGAADPSLLGKVQTLIGLMRKLNRPVEAAQYEARQREIVKHQMAINSTMPQSK